MKIWVDVDNPPQVQYLMPVAEALRSRGDDILITARAYGSTVELLRQRGVRARVVGREFGAQRHAKAIGVLRRAGALLRIVLTQGRSDVLLSSSRSSAVAARLAGIPCLIVSDYEHSELGLYRKTGAHLLHPDVIPQEAFAGWSPSRLHSFRGIKEDLTIGAADLDSVEPFAIAPEHNGRQRVLFRPPAEESHYFQPRSRQLALQVLSQLAADEARVVVFTPRHAHQVHDLETLSWAAPPVVLERPAPFMSLLAAADVVVSAGGTMLREAAYLGIPAISIFQSEVGAVDRALEAEGRLVHVTDVQAFAAAIGQRRQRLPARRTPGALDDVLGWIDRAGAGGL